METEEKERNKEKQEECLGDNVVTSSNAFSLPWLLLPHPASHNLQRRRRRRLPSTIVSSLEIQRNNHHGNVFAQCY